ncbi:unnamed protein product [Urochloa humidicola]
MQEQAIYEREPEERERERLTARGEATLRNRTPSSTSGVRPSPPPPPPPPDMEVDDPAGAGGGAARAGEAPRGLEEAPRASSKIATSPTAASTVPAAAASAAGVAKTFARSRAVLGEGAPPMEGPKPPTSRLVRRLNASTRAASGIWGSSGRLADSEDNSAAEHKRSTHPLEASLAPTATSKPAASFRVITAPVRAAPAQDISLSIAGRGEVNYSEEFEKLTKSVVKMASGLSKVFSGFRLKVIDKEEKDKRAAVERKAAEQKKLEEEKLIAEQRMILEKFGPAKVAEWKRKKQEEDAIKKKEEEKDKMIAFLLSLPGHLIDVSTVFKGVGEVAYGSKDTAVVMHQMIRGIPSLMRRRYFNAPPGRLAGTSVMGTGSCGLRMALGRHIVTRGYDSRISVIDGFGIRKETIPRAMGGKLVITNMAELSKAIADFRDGRLSQILDIDPEQVTFATAHDLWCVLCNEELTGLLAQDSALPEIALRASALMQEEEALKAHLQDAKLAVKELKSCADVLGQKLRRSTAKERRKVKCD